MKNKLCTKCKCLKSYSAFSAIKKTGKLIARCKQCTSDINKQRRLANIDKLRIKEQAYREANREHIRKSYVSAEKAREYYLNDKENLLAKHKRYNKENKQVIAKQKALYYLQHKEKIKAVQSVYYANNKDKVYAKCGTRRAKKLRATPNWLTKEDYLIINNIYKKAKELTQTTGIKHHVDHIYPLQGEIVSGLHCPANLQILTAKENLAKGNSFPEAKYLKEPKWQQ